nr:helicase associated domain-containing protein [Streptomyces sp. BE303]
MGRARRSSGVAKPLGPGGVVRVAPLHREMTLSFVGRVAARYHVDTRSLLAALVEVDRLQNLLGSVRPDSEVYLNAAARARLSVLSQIPEESLRRALPAWAQEEPRPLYAPGPTAMLTAGVDKVVGWGPACPGCVAVRTGRRDGARVYLAPHRQVCGRHRYWSMAVPGTGGLLVGLASQPEVVLAQRRHQRLLRGSPIGQEAFETARAVTAWWWSLGWPEETLWPARLEATRPAEEAAGRWRVLARDLVAYPETVTVAAVLADPGVRRRLIADAGGHLPYRLGNLPSLIGELTERLGRPWIADRLSPLTLGPLFTWAHKASTGEAGYGAAPLKLGLWEVHSGHRPRHLAEDLADHDRRARGGNTEGQSASKHRRGHSRKGDRSFTTGLAHARDYAAANGHLATRKDTVQDGFPLGDWMSNQRSHHLGMPLWRSTALHALDPWWNAPWPTQWQRTWHRAKTHTQAHGPLDAAAGFPGTDISLGEWLHLQCTRYPQLHPEQRRLLGELGIDSVAAAIARPRRHNIRAAAEEALAHARAWAAEHGSLAEVHTSTVHDGYPLGRWLVGQRGRAGLGKISAERAEALAAIDPWWRPPWHLRWQRDYHHARRQAHLVGGSDPSVYWSVMSESARAWLKAQQRLWKELHPSQQHLLAGIGITAAGVLPGVALPVPVVPVPVIGPPTALDRAAHPEKLGDARARRDHALTHARRWATEHDHLAVPSDHLTDSGFPLGRWLAEQRRRAKTRSRHGAPPPAHAQVLADLDPWWNPPWDMQWQRSYYRARDHVHACLPWDPARRILVAQGSALGYWVKSQRGVYDQLHPGQRELLTAIGITEGTKRRRPTDSPEKR